MAISHQTHDVQERQFCVVRFTLTDENDTVIPLVSINTLTLTLYDKNTLAIINSRNAQNVLNANNVTVDATSGLVEWAVQTLDGVIQNTALAIEPHVGLFVVTWASSTKVFQHEVRFNVANITEYP